MKKIDSSVIAPTQEESLKMLGSIPRYSLKAGPKCCYNQCSRCKCGESPQLNTVEEVLK